MTVYPNPAEDITNFTFDKALTNSSTLRILDMLGREVYMQKTSAGIQELKIDVSHLVAGTYQVEVRDIQTEKLLSTEHLMKVDR